MKSTLHKELEEKLSEGHECYILITCGKHPSNGSLDVEFSYGGDDPILASCLLSQAQAVIDEEVEDV